MTNKKMGGDLSADERRKIMTNREFFNAIISANVNEELTAHATAELEKLNKRNAQRSSKPSKTQLENEPIKAHLLEILAVKPMTASEIHEVDADLSTQKISSLCRQLVEAGKLAVEEVKIPKKGKQKQYSLVTE